MSGDSAHSDSMPLSLADPLVELGHEPSSPIWVVAIADDAIGGFPGPRDPGARELIAVMRHITIERFIEKDAEILMKDGGIS
jgi:hypothetical protein